MATFAEKKAAAKKAARSFKDVTVSMDAGLSAERDTLMQSRADLQHELEGLQNPSDQRLAQKPDTTAVDAKITAVDKKLAKIVKQEHDTLVTIRVYKIPPVEWGDLTVEHPPRKGVELDANFGCDMRAVCRAAAVDHARIIDGTDELAQTAEEWDENWLLVSTPDFNEFVEAVFHVNVAEPAMRLVRLKNSYEAATASNKK